MKILIDMNLSPRWVDFLQRYEHDAVHWSSVGELNASDFEIMQYAFEHEFVVLTNDLDFSAILSATAGKKPSVVQIRANNLKPEVIGHQILLALSQMQEELDVGALITIDPKKTRLRVLPLKI